MKNAFIRYIILRVLQCLMVIFVGITVTFMIPRFTPVDPVEQAITRMTMFQASTHPEAIEEMRTSLATLYGLEGSIFEQYLGFWGRLLQGDLGPSLSSFPRPVMTLIRTSLPWTAGLLLTSTIISWTLGNIIGAFAGYFHHKKWSQVLGVVALMVWPIPYYIFAFVLLVLLAYVIPLFPLSGAFAIGATPGLNWHFVSSVIRHGFLPALSIVAIGFGGQFLGMRSLVSNVISEDYILYAEIAGVPNHRILKNYVIRNALLPQITGLALQLGMIFNGAMITEFVFSYPGIGYLAYTAIFAGDFSLIMGIAIFSIVAVAVAVLIIDLLYPVFDPRVKLR